MRTQFSQSKLPVFIALSLAIHLVWFLGNRTWHIDFPAQHDQQMAVRINSQHPVAENRQRSEKTIPETVSPYKAASAKQESQSTPKETQPFNQLAHARVLSHIKQQVANHFRYPYLARRQGWQGRVLLVFSVNHLGNIENIRVKQSSGYAILDNSAIEALNRVGRIKIRQEWQLSANRQFELPVIYRLQKG